VTLQYSKQYCSLFVTVTQIYGQKLLTHFFFC